MKNNIKTTLRAGIVFLLIAGAVLGYLESGLTPEKLRALGQSHPVFLIAAFFTLPFIGAPISLFLLALGVVFPLYMSILLLVVGMSVHMCGSYALSIFLFRDLSQRLLDNYPRAKSWLHIKDSNFAITTFLFFFIPGIPYAAKNYVFPLSDVPFRIYAGIGIPTHIALGILFVVLGQQWVEGNQTSLLIIFGAIIAVSLTSHLVRKSIRRNPEESS